jgi:hypothetical protein
MLAFGLTASCRRLFDGQLLLAELQPDDDRQHNACTKKPYAGVWGCFF